jgi:hypothetical protein
VVVKTTFLVEKDKWKEVLGHLMNNLETIKRLDTRKKPGKQKNISNIITEIKTIKNQYRTAQKITSCLFIDKEKDCTFYRYEKEPRLLLEKLYPDTSSIRRKKIGSSGNYYWVHRAIYLFCEDCTAYLSKEHVEKIKTYIDIV